jgi:hypothetical protein
MFGPRPGSCTILSGPATKHWMQRALSVFGDTRTARLASISVAHLCHVRGAAGYRARRPQGTKTHRTGIAIGARRAAVRLAAHRQRLPER